MNKHLSILFAGGKKEKRNEEEEAKVSLPDLNDLNVPFHERFSETKRDQKTSLTLRRLAMVGGVMPTLARTTLFYLWKGPKHASWNLSYNIMVDGVRAFLLKSRGEGPPDFLLTQHQSATANVKVKKGVTVKEEHISPNPDVIKFFRENCPGEWASPSEDVEVQVLGEWISASSSIDASRVILEFHGGGYVNGSSKTHRNISVALSESSNCQVFSLNYRLAPIHPFPCGLIDALSAYIYLIKEKGFDPKKIAISGDSAGGGLALGLAMAIRDWNKLAGSIIVPPPAALYMQSPWCDLTHSHTGSFFGNKELDWPSEQPHDPRKFIRSTSSSISGSATSLSTFHEEGLEYREHYYAPNELLQLPYVSPFFGTFENLPKMLIQVGAVERLADEIIATARKAGRTAGNDERVRLESYEGHTHVFQMFESFSKAAGVSMKRAGIFLLEAFNAENDCLKKSGDGYDLVMSFDGSKVLSSKDWNNAHNEEEKGGLVDKPRISAENTVLDLD